MITSRKPPRTRTFLAFALVISALIHFFGGGLLTRFNHAVAAIVRPQQHDQEDVATSDVIRIERQEVPRPAVRRTAPRRAVMPPRPPQPRPLAVAPKLPQPQAQPVEKPQRPSRRRPRPAPTAQPELAHVALHRAPRRVATADSGDAPQLDFAPPKTSLSAEQIQQLDRRFAKTIADARTDLATIQQQTKQPPSTVKHYAMQFNGIHADMQRGEGYIHPIAPPRRAGNLVYYYTHYEYMYPDGHVEEDDIPWPFVYTLREDPFARGVRKIPLQPPPPGFQPNRQLQPILMQFFGGPPID